MKLFTVVIVLVGVGIAAVVLNIMIYNRMVIKSSSTIENLGAQIEVGYSALQREIDTLKQLQKSSKMGSVSSQDLLSGI